MLGAHCWSIADGAVVMSRWTCTIATILMYYKDSSIHGWYARACNSCSACMRAVHAVRAVQCYLKGLLGCCASAGHCCPGAAAPPALRHVGHAVSTESSVLTRGSWVTSEGTAHRECVSKGHNTLCVSESRRWQVSHYWSSRELRWCVRERVSLPRCIMTHSALVCQGKSYTVRLSYGVISDSSMQQRQL